MDFKIFLLIMLQTNLKSLITIMIIFNFNQLGFKTLVLHLTKLITGIAFQKN